MPRIKITEATETAARLVLAICSQAIFREDEIEHLCQCLELDPFQLRELFERAAAPAADIPVSHEAMPPAWYDNNVQLSRLVLELNEILAFSKSDWEEVREQAGLSQAEVSGLFQALRQQLADAAKKYAV